jgi:hypothetical protein
VIALLLLHSSLTFPILPTLKLRPTRRIGNGSANNDILPKPRHSWESFVTALQTAQEVAQEVVQEVALVAPAPPQVIRRTR